MVYAINALLINSLLVVSRKYGTVVVPHGSNFAALLNAAEVWGCDWTEIRDAEVWRADKEERPVPMPHLI